MNAAYADITSDLHLTVRFEEDWHYVGFVQQLYGFGEGRLVYVIDIKRSYLKN